MADGKSGIIHPVVLSGGSGSRLWPLSREQHPKQLLAPFGGQTLLQEACSRIDRLSPGIPPLVVCNEEYRFVVAEQLRLIGKSGRIVLEPVGRNTAPALTCAALVLTDQEPDALMLVMPSDHLIADRAAFEHAVRAAAVVAHERAIVTFGVVPDRPETGYGYIKQGPGGAVEAFVEKPDAALAARYVESGEYLWNSGLFMMRPDVWLEEIGRFAPGILEACRRACDLAQQDETFFRLDAESFKACPSDSIDYAVMEKTSRARVCLLDARWSDIGAWSSLWQQAPRDDNDNLLQGDVVSRDSRGSLVIAQSRLVAALGLRDMVVVETADAVLVAPKDRVQEVKELVQALGADGREECKHHRKVHRPWGSYESVDAGDGFQVKRLIVHPGASLSLQMHHHRAEHWVVVRGAARVTCGDNEFMLTENQSTYIPMGSRHRLENPGMIPLEVVEVQSGRYLGEDDIVRFADTYKRHLPA
ncbi:MAG: mannose-1-phosphate guanylyltransferase/mannose-6-phosphate isomerase [Acidiferrobacteraceae bacterium]